MCKWLFFLFALYSTPDLALAGKVGIEYGQTPNLFSTYSDIKHAKGDLSKINTVLNREYGHVEEGFARIYGTTKFFDKTFHIEAQAVAIGLVRNPVVPELKAGMDIALLLQMDFPFSLNKYQFMISPVLGYGKEIRISAISTDLIDTIPVKRKRLMVAGIDLKASRKLQLADKLDLLLEVRTKESIYDGVQLTNTSFEDQKVRNWTHDWRLKSDFVFPFLKAHLILGAHPLPIDLPRMWDRAANYYAFPELGVMSGAGLEGYYNFNSNTYVGAIGGLYSGYFGGSLMFSISGLKLQISSWRVENSAVYHTLAERFTSGIIEFTF